MKKTTPIGSSETAIRPLGSRIIVRLVEERTSSLILIPDAAKTDSRLAEIVALGPGRRESIGNRMPSELRTGDRVIVSKYGQHTKVKTGGETLYIIESGAVLAVVE